MTGSPFGTPPACTMRVGCSFGPVWDCPEETTHIMSPPRSSPLSISSFIYAHYPSLNTTADSFFNRGWLYQINSLHNSIWIDNDVSRYSAIGSLRNNRPSNHL